MRKEKFQPWIADLIQKHGGIYTTPNNFELIVDEEDGSFSFHGRWAGDETPGSPEIRIDIGRVFDDYNAFTYVFPIQHLTDLDHLTPGGLFKLYAMGDIWIATLAEEDLIFEDLTFRIEDGATRIWDNEGEQVIPYSGNLLSTPQQITIFTRKYIKSKYQLQEGAGHIRSGLPI
jgi:hypothetical protein